MLLSNNNEYTVQPAVQRRPKNERRSRDKGMAASSSARNSWSFSVEPVMSQQHPQSVLLQQQQYQPLQCVTQEGYYFDAEGLFTKLQQPPAEAKPQSVSRSRLRQRSTSNLAASGLRSRDQSASGKQGTVAKGVDYIRINQPTLRVANTTPTCDQTEIQDRSEYGNPDGSSAHSTAEREAVLTGKSSETPPPIHPADLCQVINQNQSNDFKSKRATPPLIIAPEESKTACSSGSSTAGDAPEPLPVRLGSGRGSARFTSKSTEMSSRKSTSQSSAAVKTEWTFVPPSAAPPMVVCEAENHETSANMKPEESSLVRKGLLWVMRDRLFSRWHERYCILTHNYLHCFKRGSDANQLTQMGNFLFKVNLAEVTAVQWLDKRGTAIVCLNLAKEGRLLVKTSHDLNGWYQDFQNCVKETRGRRQTLLERSNNKNGPDMVPIITTATSSSSSSGGQRRPAPQSSTVIQPAALREKANRTGSAKSRQVNRYSLMSEVELKLNSSVEKNDIHLIATEQHQSLLNNGMPAPPPVPIPYRERSVSFDRSRASCKAEREVKRRSYYPNHVTQV